MHRLLQNEIFVEKDERNGPKTARAAHAALAYRATRAMRAAAKRPRKKNRAPAGRPVCRNGALATAVRSARQLRAAHQVRVDRARALAAFADRPDDERLAAAHVARGEHLVDRRVVRAIALGARARVAARVLRDAERLEHGRGRLRETHREQHEVGLDLELGIRHFLHLAVDPRDARRDQLLDLAVPAFETFRRHRPVALAAFLVRRRRAQLDRPVRPHERLVLRLGRLRQQLELRDVLRAVAVRRADAIRTRVAAADHDDVLALREQLIGQLVARVHAVLLRQELHREMDAGELAPRHRQIARRLRAARDHDRVELVLQRLGRNRLLRHVADRLGQRIAADEHARAERHAFRFHLAHPAVDQPLLELEIGNPVTQQAADPVALLEHRHVVARARELLRGGKARGARADHRDLLARLVRGGLRRDPALRPCLVDDRVLDRLDADRIVMDAERARRFARRRADAARELREVVRRMQHVDRLTPFLAIHEIVEVRNDVVDGAAVVAKRNAAIHAACALDLRVRVGQRRDELLVVLHARERRLVRLVTALVLQKTGDLAHEVLF
ncbi:hypothetical protein BURPS1710b_3715 [Burkholderia pseudomallei 1710b]|uniref:Uncharacterized protein n=1 Tax=Burkholderia pseudomallei (strain 1710b) TaxID=320372 RepID=Q3JMX4_BURP1|nr:hypothetical protein BURPS1710b_3715 [Burkholderia pseudomallei 1710b]